MTTTAANARLRAPYLLFLGDIQDETFGKTGYGLLQWCPERVAGQIRLPGCGLDLGIPDLTISEAADKGVASLVISIAPIGGQLPDNWFPVIREALACGMDIVSGLHSKLMDVQEFVDRARESGAELIDVRTPPVGIPIGSGEKRSGKRALMVGTDCAVGKKYSALALTQAMNDLGMTATFRATGQTGIMIAGEGIAVDAVVSDFISGAAELISPANEPEHWDIVEGQGSLFNPGFAGVTLGLIHGSQADALVMCHEATLSSIVGREDYPIPPLDECMQTYLQLAKLTNPEVQFVGLSINSSTLAEAERRPYLENLSEQFNLPCVDPVANGSASIAEYIQNNFDS